MYSVSSTVLEHSRGFDDYELCKLMLIFHLLENLKNAGWSAVLVSAVVLVYCRLGGFIVWLKHMGFYNIWGE